MYCPLEVISGIVVRFLYGWKFCTLCWWWGFFYTFFAFVRMFRVTWRLIRMTIFILSLFTFPFIDALILWLLTWWTFWAIIWILFLTFCILIELIVLCILGLQLFLLVLLLRSRWRHHVWLVIRVRWVHHRWHHALVLRILTMSTIIFTQYHL